MSHSHGSVVAAVLFCDWFLFREIILAYNISFDYHRQANISLPPHTEVGFRIDKRFRETSWGKKSNSWLISSVERIEKFSFIDAFIFFNTLTLFF